MGLRACSGRFRCGVLGWLRDVLEIGAVVPVGFWVVPVVPGGSRFWVSSGSNLHKALLHSDSCALAHVTVSYEYDAFAVGDTTLCMFFEINCMNYQARTLAAF